MLYLFFSSIGVKIENSNFDTLCWIEIRKLVAQKLSGIIMILHWFFNRSAVQNCPLDDDEDRASMTAEQRQKQMDASQAQIKQITGT